MDLRSRLALSLASSLLIVACGGTGAGGGGDTTAHSQQRPPYTPCDDASAIRMAPTVCWNPTGSHWRVQADAPGGSYTFDVELMAGGRVRATDVAGATPATDEWFAENDVLRIFLQNRYVEYRATLHNGTMLLGTAVNVRGDEWPFRADRVHVATSCPAEELATTGGDEPGCFDVAGSRWTVTAGNREYELQFGENGALLSTDPSDTTQGDDGWEQQGGTVHYWLNDRATEVTATLTASDLTHFTGSGHDAQGAPISVRATAIPTYAPPIH
ncbi:MAG: hypothetical protein U0234_03125 [Sandaracinus sp.]